MVLKTILFLIFICSSFIFFYFGYKELKNADFTKSIQIVKDETKTLEKKK